MRKNAISKLYRFKKFMPVIRFVDQVAEIAETAGHQPGIFIDYTNVTFTCSTHNAGGVTEKDFALTREIEHAFEGLAT